MNGREKSHSAIVAVKPTNKAGRPVAEPAEPRAGTEGNAKPGDTLWTPSQESASHGLDGVREGSKGRESNPTSTLASPSTTRGRNRMPELGTYGSVRGALSNGRPYRDPFSFFDRREPRKAGLMERKIGRAGDWPVLPRWARLTARSAALLEFFRRAEHVRSERPPTFSVHR